MKPTSRCLNPRTRLALLQTLRKQKGLARGFTLIELMITVAIVGLISAVALPQFLGARNAAEAGANIGEKVGLAKECATYVASGGIGTLPNTGGTCATTGGSYTATWSATASGIKCLGVDVSAKTTAAVAVSSSGSLSCT